MKQLISKKDPTKIMILAMSDNDVEVMDCLWNNKVLFGAWLLVDAEKIQGHPENPDYKSYNPIIEANPGVKKIMRVNLVAGFAGDVR